MSTLENLLAAFPDWARDSKLNLTTTLTSGSLTPEQRWGIAVAVAISSGERTLRDKLTAEASLVVSPAVIEDAQAAAALMGMNNVYYRFRHMSGNPIYSELPARLRMNRMIKPVTNQADFELISLAVSAVNGCEACIQAHEHAVKKAGMTEENVHDAVRLAASVASAAQVLKAIT